MNFAKSIKLLTVVIAAACLPALASASVGPATVKVFYADLDADRLEDAQVLYTRLKRASHNVCDMDEIENYRSLARIANAKRCYANTLSDAVEEVDNELLSALHDAQSHSG